VVDFDNLMQPGYTRADGLGSPEAKHHSYLIVLMHDEPSFVRYLRKNTVLFTTVHWLTHTKRKLSDRTVLRQ